jgi:hypothetical protein
VDVLADGEVNLQITIRADLAVERPPLKVVGEALGHPPADLLGLFIPDGAGAGEFGPRANSYLQPGLIFLAITTRRRVPSASGCESESTSQVSEIAVLVLAAPPLLDRW